jgi:hypothetical protein
MLTLSLKFKLTSVYLAVLRIIHTPDVIKEDTRFVYVGIQHQRKCKFPSEDDPDGTLLANERKTSHGWGYWRPNVALTSLVLKGFQTFIHSGWY